MRKTVKSVFMKYSIIYQNQIYHYGGTSPNLKNWKENNAAYGERVLQGICRYGGGLRKAEKKEIIT